MNETSRMFRQATDTLGLLSKQKFLVLWVLLFGGWAAADAQIITTRGKVVDENNEAAIGASIRVKEDPSKGTVTSVDGTFTLQVNEKDVLVISYVGYKTVERKAEAQLLVKLEPDHQVLDDVVVVGYMTRKVANTSASVVKVDGTQLAMKPASHPLDAVQGKVAGLQVYSSSGEPSAGLSLALHGQGSLGAGTAPLVILDGIPVSMNTVKSMNPNDIESVQFLKDAAATSIYGARAANGVMYISTKRGKMEDRARITVRGQYAVSSLANTDYFDQLMSGPELIRYYLETGLYTQDQVDYFKENIFKGTDFSWYKYIYQPAPMYSVDASISGGSNRTNYYVSGGCMSQDGLRMGSSYRKAFARLNLNSTLNKYIRMAINTSASFDKTRTSPFGNSNVSGGGLAAMNPPFVSPFDPDSGRELEFVPLLNISTPKHMVETHPSQMKSMALTANANVTITPMENLTLRSLVGVEAAYGTSQSRVLPSYRYAFGMGSSSRNYNNAVNFSVTNTISYLKQLKEHNLTFLVGHEFVNYKDDGFSAGGNGLLDDRLTLLGNVTKDHYMSEGGVSYAFLSFFTQVSYDFRERYFVDLVARNDASSRFGSNKRNGLFWSVGLLWKMKKEGFLHDVNWLDNLDLKASYGTQGNTSIPPYAIHSYAGKVGQKKGGMSMGFISQGNPDLGWEKQSKLTVGVKANLLKRLELNVEYYRRETSDMLFEVPLSLSTGLPVGSLGFVSRFENVGRYLNQGVDVMLRADLLRSRKFGLSAYVNFNYNKDKVLELFEGRQSWFEPGSQMGYIVGKPITYFIPLYKGINPDNGHPEWFVPGENIGVPTRRDDQVVDEWSSKLEQNTEVPVYTPMTGGWGIEAHWMGFYLSADFAFAINKRMLSMDKMYYENDYYIRDKEGNLNGSRRLFNYWKQAGDRAEFPSLEYVRSHNHQSTYLDSKLLENASFMRMKNLTIGYNVPQSWLKKQRIIQSARVHFTGRNLLTFTDFRGIDPEVNQSVAFGVNPNTKQLSFGFELGF